MKIYQALLKAVLFDQNRFIYGRMHIDQALVEQKEKFSFLWKPYMLLYCENLVWPIVLSKWSFSYFCILFVSFPLNFFLLGGGKGVKLFKK